MNHIYICRYKLMIYICTIYYDKFKISNYLHMFFYQLIISPLWIPKGQPQKAQLLAIEAMAHEYFDDLPMKMQGFP